MNATDTVSPARERHASAGVLTAIAAVNLVGWGVLLLLVAPQGLRLSDGSAFGVGLGVTAFLLGARHALDADHIALIDGATRSLAARQRAGLRPGFWFALGHSSVVFALCVAIALGVRTLPAGFTDGSSDLQRTFGLVGTLAAVAFLLWLCAANARRLRSHLRHEPTGHGPHGPLGHLAHQALGGVSAPRHLYPMGLLMGLGFDTATQVALLVMAGGSAALLPWYAILVLPVLFAGGMLIVDSLDSALMARAWADADLAPARARLYDVAVSAACVLASFVIATVMLLELARVALPFDSTVVGLGLVGTFLALWLVRATATPRH